MLAGTTWVINTIAAMVYITGIIEHMPLVVIVNDVGIMALAIYYIGLLVGWQSQSLWRRRHARWCWLLI